MSELIKHVSDNTFEEEVLKDDLPVLVDFWAVWCAPCHMVTPALENMAESMKDKLKVAKVNVDENAALSARYGIMSIPALLLFKGGELKETLIGALPQNKIEEKIAPHL